VYGALQRRHSFYIIYVILLSHYIFVNCCCISAWSPKSVVDRMRVLSAHVLTVTVHNLHIQFISNINIYFSFIVFKYINQC